MNRILVTSWTGFFGRLANVRLLAAARELRIMEESPTRIPQEPATMHVAAGLDAVAGSEFVDDRIRLRE
jgi:hypothetical protein